MDANPRLLLLVIFPPCTLCCSCLAVESAPREIGELLLFHSLTLTYEK